MKKILLSLVLLLIPVVASANSGPLFSKYEAVITNPEGAKVYKLDGNQSNLQFDNKTISYNKTVTIVAELVDINNELYGCIYLNNNYDTEAYIKLSDVAINKNYNFSDAFKKERDLYVYNDTKLFAGPALKYDVLANVPKGTVLHTVYSAGSGMWSYVNYNGKKGWLYIGGRPLYSNDKSYKSIKGVAVSLDQIIILNKDMNIKFYDLPIEGSNYKEYSYSTNSKIYTKYTSSFNLYYEGEHEEWVYVEESDKKGWISLKEIMQYDHNTKDLGSRIFINETGKIIVFDNKINVFSNINDIYNEDENTQNMVTISVKENSELGYVYYLPGADDPDIFCIEYNGHIYYISVSNNKIATPLHFYADDDYKVKVDTNLYETPLNNKIVTTLKMGEVINKVIYRFSGDKYWVYVETNDKKGWIDFDALESYINIIDEENLNDDNEVAEDEEPITISKKEINKPNRIIKYSIIGVILVVLSSIFAIVLVNKKRNKKGVSI